MKCDCLRSLRCCRRRSSAFAADSLLRHRHSVREVRAANGLTLIVHEDHKAPIVAVNIWYHVGSKDERPGRTGFAHLFEHLMFNGSENYNDEFFRPLEPAGATKMNGTTWLDRTNYFQNVPTSRARPHAVDGVRPHGPPARRHRPEEARRAARRGAEREAPGREPAVRQGRRAHHREHLSGRPSVFVGNHRLDGRPERRLARRREGVVPHLLRRRERGARDRRRHQRRPTPRRRSRSTSATFPPAR